MLHFSWRRWLQQALGLEKAGPRKTGMRASFETLEDRLVPANITVLGTADVAPGSVTPLTVVPGGFTAANLRSAVAGANTHAGNDVILLSTATYDLQQGALVIDDTSGGTLQIKNKGSGLSTIDANYRNRIIDNEGSLSETATLTNLVLQHGQDSYGGAIVNRGKMVIQNSKIQDNLAQGTDSVNNAEGGGIWNGPEADLQITNSTILRNVAGGVVASGSFPGGRAEGGGIYNDLSASLSITNSTLQDNEANGGDGNSNFNGGDGEGGGLYLEGGSAPTVTIKGSTFDGNTANGGLIGAEGNSINQGGVARGGGLYKGGSDEEDSQDLDVFNSTFSGNAAYGGGDSSSGHRPGIAQGGALYISSLSGGTVRLTNDTIAENLASGGYGGGSAASYGGGIAQGDGYGGSIQPLNTIIALNSALFDSDVNGSFSSQGNNLLGDTGSATGFGIADFSGHNIDVNLAPLDYYNGGKTKTYALLPKSFAIDRGSNSVLSSPFSFTTDQNGKARRSALFVDIGAYEITRPSLNRTYFMRSNTTLTTTTSNGLLAGADFPGAGVALSGGPPAGLLSLNKDGTFAYTPPRNFAGVVTFKFKVFFGEGERDFLEFTAAIHVIRNYRLGPYLPPPPPPTVI